MRRRLALVCLALLAGLATALATMPGRAMAHAALIHSDPADGAVLAAAPSRIVLHFNEAVTPLAVRLIEADGSAQNLSLPAPSEILAIVPPALAKGSYALSWRVVSEDGHPVGGSILFSVGSPSGRQLSIADEADPAARIGIWLARLAIACGLTFGVGGVVISRFFGQPKGRISQPLGAILATALAGSLMLPGFQGLDALDVPVAALTQAAVWRTGAATSYGTTASLAAMACLAGLAAMALRGRAGTLLAVLALGLAALAPAASGHAASAAPRTLMTPTVALHVLGVALWLGALVALAAVFRRRDGDCDLLRRLSPLLPIPVAVLAGSGVALAVVQVGTPTGLLSTAYGRVLVAKLALIATLLAVAAANRWLWTKAALGGDAAARSKLSRGVAVEIVLGVAILGVAGLWRFTPPPRAIAAEQTTPATVHIHTDQAMAEVTLTPGRVGPVTASISIMTGDFGPLDAKEVSLSMSRPDLGLEPVERQAKKEDEGTWTVQSLALPVAGKWKVRVSILVDEFHLAKLDGEVVLRP